MKNRMFGRIAGESSGAWRLKALRQATIESISQLVGGLTALALALFSLSTGNAAANDAVLLEFSSAHCGPCQAMQPIVGQLERSGVPVRHVDVRSEPQLASRYGIRQTPTFVVLSGGKEVTRLVGMHSAQEIRAALAISPSGPLISTGADFERQPIAAPQTRLAPITQPPSLQPISGGAAARLNLPRSEPMPSASQAGAVELARAATVRLRVHDEMGFGAGTGTIIDTQGDEALVMTCGHLFRENKGQGKIEVDLFVGGQIQTVLGQVLDYDADNHDIALVVIRPGFAVQPVSVSVTDQHIRNGQPVFSFGCDRGDDPTRRDTRITGVNTFNQESGASNLKIAGAPVQGRSGGGLFDAQGRLIGVCNGANFEDDFGFYTGPGSIRWQLDRANLAHIYQAPNRAGEGMSGTSPERLASLNTPGNHAVAPPHPIAATSHQEVIVIVRDRDNPNATSRVMNLEPSAELMNTLERYSR